MQKKTNDYYEILEVHRNASQEVIDKAYKTLAKKYHPDLNSDYSKFFTEKMQILNEAYEIISDSKKREKYNYEYDKPEKSNLTFGTYNYSDGCVYVGEVKDSIPNGKGTYTWSNGDKYVGDFKDGLQNGQGITYYKNGDKYEGAFNLGLKTGYGVYTCADGSKYAGEFRNGIRNGRGAMTNSSGLGIDGIWDNGKLTQPIKGFHSGKNQTPLSFDFDAFHMPEKKTRKKINTRDKVSYTMISFFLVMIVFLVVKGQIENSTSSNYTPLPSSTITYTEPKPSPSITVQPRSPSPTPKILYPQQPYPVNGAVFVKNSEERVAPFSIETSGTNYYYVKLLEYGTKNTVIAAFIHPGETISFDVPLGRYELRYATGDIWYGEEHLFGENGMGFKADEVFNFTFDGVQYNGYTVELVLQVDGNLSTQSIDMDDF
jgi:curved DNA-binding protein CbpA